MSSMNKTGEGPVVNVIRVMIVSWLSLLLIVKRRELKSIDQDRREEKYPDLERTVRKPHGLKDYAALAIFLFGVLFIALMLLLGLAIPAIFMTCLGLLLMECRTRYRTGMTGKNLSIGR